MNPGLLLLGAILTVWALSQRSESLLGAYWRPSCASNWMQIRADECRGQTTGPVPSIDLVRWTS